VQHEAELRDALMRLDAEKCKALWKQIAPHLFDEEAHADPIFTYSAMHMARVTMRDVSPKMRQYSKDWLRDQGLEFAPGKGWQRVTPKPTGILAGSVGIAVMSKVPRHKRYITDSMVGAVENCLGKGVMEPERQKEASLKARNKARFKLRIA
jgi:hypothetical protein